MINFYEGNFYFIFSNSIIPYFKGIANYLNSDYNIGIYETRNTCKRVTSEVSRVTNRIANVTLNDSVYGTMEIDKIVYSGNIPAISFLETDKQSNSKY